MGWKERASERGVIQSTQSIRPVPVRVLWASHAWLLLCLPLSLASPSRSLAHSLLSARRFSFAPSSPRVGRPMSRFGKTMNTDERIAFDLPACSCSVYGDGVCLARALRRQRRASQKVVSQVCERCRASQGVAGR